MQILLGNTVSSAGVHSLTLGGLLLELDLMVALNEKSKDHHSSLLMTITVNICSDGSFKIQKMWTVRLQQK